MWKYFEDERVDIQWLMSVKLHRPPTLEESQKISNFQRKKPYLTQDSNLEPLG
jgi:hypothetical protein